MPPLQPERIGLYVHVPWCVKKCPYCDFNSHELRSPLQEQRYFACLGRDLETELARTRATVDTVFFGGGTPSLISPDSYAQFLSHPALQDAQEITMEANPGALECGSLNHYRAAGITRLSIGVQSLRESSLRKLGRIHSPAEARKAVDHAFSAGFQSVNVDMMYGLPDQSLDQAMQDLADLIGLGAPHISWYQLTLEPNTVFGKRPPNVASDDERADMSDAGIDMLIRTGYQPYEVSAFARQPRENRCKHNVNYWRFGDYLGVGAGAHGKLTLADGRVIRTQKTRQPEAYMQDPNTQIRTITPEEAPVEFMMNALRLYDGVANELFEQTTGLKLETIEPTLNELREEGLLEPHRIALTQFGHNHLNTVVERFLDISGN